MEHLASVVVIGGYSSYYTELLPIARIDNRIHLLRDALIFSSLDAGGRY